MIQQIQQEFDDLFKSLKAGQINTDQYRVACDNLFLKIPQCYERTNLLKRINNRTDGSRPRTCGEFAREIYLNAQKERDVVTRWAEKMVKAGRICSFNIKDHGMDNTGSMQIVRGSVNCNADFTIDFGNDRPCLFEVKINNYGLRKATFKVHNLENYVRNKASILMVWIDMRDTYWAVINPQAIRNILDDYPRSNRREMGNMCDTVQLTQQDYHKYFQVEKL